MAVRRDSVWKYCWGVLMVLCRTAISRSIVLEPIYWNSSNSKFLPGQGLVLYPQIGDKLDIICPKVDSKTVGQYEYYKVYMVDKDQADRCTIKKENTPLLNCARPDQDVKFTIKFQEFSPNLWGLEFQKNRDYYIISTSNGSLEGLDNQEGGVCQTRAMKILMKVGQDASSAGSTRHNDPTRRPELEAGTNGRSSTTSPFVKPNPASSRPAPARAVTLPAALSHPLQVPAQTATAPDILGTISWVPKWPYSQGLLQGASSSSSSSSRWWSCCSSIGDGTASTRRSTRPRCRSARWPRPSAAATTTARSPATSSSRCGLRTVSSALTTRRSAGTTGIPCT
ncbi:ephrin-B2 isoform X1 [Monodon monoceros]|uniref:ephrin-B2 isoform X1 n=1 Tax=Monodon monoceros TaxID=40151 RepID=UPI0010F45EF3|nr:ephrin-B2 isoform X1 [Monodon monoceros]